MAEAFAIITMTGGAIALILFIDWILTGWIEFTDEPINEFADADTRTAALRNSLIDGGKERAATKDLLWAGERAGIGSGPLSIGTQSRSPSHGERGGL
jgi:hypothetical protein